MLIIGHRCAPSLEPENTIRSFKKAQELGVDMVEMDLRQSADGEIVISHDASLQRLFGIDKEISELSLASLKEMTIDRGREMATLAEALAQINLPVNLHIKVRFGREADFAGSRFSAQSFNFLYLPRSA